MNDIILQKLQAIEQEKQVKIIYACESGSRAWGFASPDSDYDVRFIYARPAESYLSIIERPDVIELPVDEVLDINGWDIRKALQLFLKSNAPLYEWLQSPIVYATNGELEKELGKLAPAYFSSRAGCHHYFSMARNVFENDLQAGEVKLKKYFYALRPALAGLWIMENQTVPPMEFGKLRTLVADKEWHAVVDQLLEEKKRANERELRPAIPLLQEWIRRVLENSKEKVANMPVVKRDTQELDVLFRKLIGSHDL